LVVGRFGGDALFEGRHNLGLALDVAGDDHGGW
jgi:hypothetical protein